MLGKDSKLLHHQVVNIIQHHTDITGDIHCKGDLRLDGTVKGNVYVSGRLVMGHDAVIEGTIECENAEISGKVKGDIKVKETLQLKKHCQIEGDIYTKKLIIEAEAVFNGKCIMKNKEQEIKNKINDKSQLVSV
ncbi:MAG: polymer-forming cytoskeletal protein [Bacteroidetes bacterium]|nr:MAG: polymer-forming cytoskeletal protein [Bacteroidota bacterium]